MQTFQFFAQNLHFAVCLFAALVSFAVAWLYFDAWSGPHHRKELLKWLGFLLISLSFLLLATKVESNFLTNGLFGRYGDVAQSILRLVGYIAIIAGRLLDPIPHRPGQDAGKTKASSAALVTAGGTSAWLLPLGSLGVAGFYFYRATTGMERHLRPVAWSFLALTGFEGLSLTAGLQNTANPGLSQLVAPFGPVWIAAQLCLLVAMVILGRWVWQYLTKRLLSQLFMIFIAITMTVFLVATVSFSYLLLGAAQQESLNNLETASRTLQYAVQGKESQTLSGVQVIGQNPAIAAAVSAGDRAALRSLTQAFLTEKKLSFLTVTSAAGQVLLRADDPDRWGDSLSGDPLIRRALIGSSSSSVTARSDVLSPLITIRSGVPVRGPGGTIVGSATAGVALDNAFFDGIKQVTGLDSAVYAGNVRSATTLRLANGSLSIGIKEQNKRITDQVLKEGKIYKGVTTVAGQPYLVVYAPLKDIDNSVVGMLLVSRPQSSILTAAAHSIELSFLMAVILLLLAIWPIYRISRQIASQLE